MKCDACGESLSRNGQFREPDCNRVRVGKVELTLCYYCSHDIHEQLSLGCLFALLQTAIKEKDWRNPK